MTRKLPKTAVYLGLASLFNDIASETIIPILPLFLTVTLGASPLFLGFLDGFIEALSSILKLISGFYSDRLKKKEPFVFMGYLISNLTKPILAFAANPVHVLLVRLADKVGKGVRTAPRDAILAASVEPNARGRVYGFNRAMDNVGATIAPLLAMLFLYFYPGKFRILFALTIIPGAIALLCVLAATKATKNESATPPQAKEKIKFSEIKNLPKEFKIFLGILFLFTLSLSTDAFLILKLNQVGLASFWIPLVWAAHNATRALFSVWGGNFVDRSGPRTSILLGWAIYALVYLSFGFTSNIFISIGILILYALFYGYTESAEKVLVVEMVERKFHGTALGLYNAVLGLGVIPAGVLFGLLWQYWGSKVAFSISAMISILATLLFVIVCRKNESRRSLS